jgi:hypothetical protein
MTVPALALVPVLVNGTGTWRSFGTLEADLVARVSRDDYQQWLVAIAPAKGCVRPIRLSGGTAVALDGDKPDLGSVKDQLRRIRQGSKWS